MTDIANFIAHHPPAIKVGGRRHSISSKHKPHTAPERAQSVPADAEVEPTDYPRPAAPQAGDEAAHVPPHNDERDEAPRKHLHDSEQRRLLELAQRKAEMARPTRDAKNSGKGFGGAGRIAQPMKDLRV
ncbi:hypothetical protein B0H15DRAFT_850573 [Mycena belliarum]|uniref:Uncharacterized protein n=1 Tax=Mycena belliarum TaxID=1033014 RepID=A0AAD6U3E7_9AGAR|nr:hypothetical protein B0H15DRAFT_850573 [Mycena belliae]